MIFRHLLVVLVFLSSYVPAAALVLEERFSGNDRVLGVHHPTDGAILDFSWELEARIGLLLGEPVVSVRLKWDNPAGILTIPTLTPKGRSYNTIRFGQLPQDLQEMPRLMDVKVRLTVSDGQNLMNIFADVGITGKPGEWSFNVPGSPDWDEFLLLSGTDTYLSEERAKAAWKRGLTLSDAILVDATLSLYDLHEAYMKGYKDRETYRVLGAAFKRLTEGLYRSYGIEAQNITNGWTDAYFVAEQNGSLLRGDEWSERLFELEKVIRKLSSLPDGLRTGNNHGPYEQAVKDATELGRSVRYAIHEFTPEGRDPKTIEVGYSPSLSGEYEMRWANGDRYIYNSDTGEQLEKLHDDEFLFGEYIVREKVVKCAKGKISIPLRAIGNSSSAQLFTFPCPADPGGPRDEKYSGGFFKGPTTDRPDQPIQFVTYVNLVTDPGIKCGKYARQSYIERHTVVYDISATLELDKAKETTTNIQAYKNC